MITEQYVEFETAKLLKEKGFDGDCMFVFNINSNGILPCSFGTKNSEIDNKNIVTMPTQSLVMRWLREVYNLFIAFYNDDLNYCWCVLNLEDRDENLDPKQVTSSYGGYETYEQAAESAIKYCLEKLI